ncbi:hypothetical protein DL93DRAFT_2164017 [Clavulina sp. PMI_390]|nr:hypothetical protein DL93DRAFT_2164017 [Clavulina sp. PMI_390]
MPKRRAPVEDGSVLLVLYNPYGLSSMDPLVRSIMTADARDSRKRMEQCLRWLHTLGLEVNGIWGKRTELAVIVDVQRSNPDDVEHAIGVYKWNELLHRCPDKYRDELAHVYRCVSTSVEHLERTLNFLPYEVIDLEDTSSFVSQDSIFSDPSPLPRMPENSEWPRPQSGLTLYVRPKALPLPRAAPRIDVDGFLSSMMPSEPLGAPSQEAESSAGPSTSVAVVSDPTEEEPHMSLAPGEEAIDEKPDITTDADAAPEDDDEEPPFEEDLTLEQIQAMLEAEQGQPAGDSLGDTATTTPGPASDPDAGGSTHPTGKKRSAAELEGPNRKPSSKSDSAKRPKKARKSTD